MAEFRVNDHLYRNRRLNARQQFHVVRRITPLVGPMSMMMMMQPTDDPETLREQMAMTGPLLEALGRMSDDDCNYVIDVCMAATQRQQGGNGAGPVTWVEVWNNAAHREMFDDIDMGAMLQICWQVIQDSLRGFSGIRPAMPAAPTMADQSPA